MNHSGLKTESWLGDDPVSGASDSPDRLGRGEFARVAVSVLQRFRQQSDSSVIALIGGWGAGKSSILNLIKRELENGEELPADRAWIVVDFNPWLYQDLPSLQAGFFNELEAALPKEQGKLKRARKKVSKFGRAIAPLGTAGTLFGIDLSGIIATFAGWVGGDRSVTGLQKSAAEALKDANRPILMVLDDLDRLDPDELLLVFKLIRLTGRLHNVYYLVSYDEGSLLDALGRTGLVGTRDPRRALDYLEKIIQVRLDVPPLREQQVIEWVDGAFDDLARRHRLNLDDDAKERFNRAYQQTLKHRLDTPRAIKRYFAQADAFLESVRGELDVVDFLLLTWLRTAEPLVYNLLVAERDKLVGSASIWPSPKTTDSGEAKQYWVDRLKRTRLDADHAEGVASLVGQLFPRFQREWAAGRVSGEVPDAKMTRVSHLEYFDRYFSFAVPPEDVSDSVLAEAYRQMIFDDHGAELASVERLFPSRTLLIVNKLRHNFEKAKKGSLPLLIWLAGQYRLIPDSNGLITPKQQLRWLSQLIYVEASADVPSAAITMAAGMPEGLVLASFWVHAADNEQNITDATEQQRSSFQTAKDHFVELVHQRFEEHRDIGPLDLNDDVWDLIWDWARISPDEARSFVHQQIEDGRWRLLDFVARLATTSSIVGVEDSSRTLSGLDLPTVDALVGLDFVFSELRQPIEDVDEPLFADRTVEATDDSRREYVLAALRLERDRRSREIDSGDPDQLR